MPKKIVNIRLRPDQEARINAIVERSAILDTSKFVRIAVGWLLRSDIGQVIKTIVDDEAYPDYAIPKKTTGRCRTLQFFLLAFAMRPFVLRAFKALIKTENKRTALDRSREIVQAPGMRKRMPGPERAPVGVPGDR
jgi:hypothetical protein